MFTNESPEYTHIFTSHIIYEGFICMQHLRCNIIMARFSNIYPGTLRSRNVLFGTFGTSELLPSSANYSNIPLTTIAKCVRV